MTNCCSCMPCLVSSSCMQFAKLLIAVSEAPAPDIALTASSSFSAANFCSAISASLALSLVTWPSCTSSSLDVSASFAVTFTTRSVAA